MKKRLWLVGVLSMVCVGGLMAADAAPEEQSPKEHVLQVALQPEQLTVGATAQYTLSLRGVAPWVVKSTTPLQVTLRPSAGLKAAKTTFGPKDYVDPEANDKRLETSVEAVTAGAQAIDAEVEFFLCTDVICKRVRDNVKIAVPVQ